MAIDHLDDVMERTMAQDIGDPTTGVVGWTAEERPIMLSRNEAAVLLNYWMGRLILLDQKEAKAGTKTTTGHDLAYAYGKIRIERLVCGGLLTWDDVEEEILSAAAIDAEQNDLTT